MLEKDDGIILGVRRSGETSLIMNFLGRRNGKVRLMAKGALSTRSPFRGMIEPGNCLEAVYYHKPDRTLYFVKETALVGAPSGRRESLTSMAALLAALEVLDQVCYPGSPDPRIVDLAESYATGAPGPDPLFAFLAFEVKLLEALGVSPETSGCAECACKIDEGVYVPAEGATYCRDHAPSGHDTVRMPADARALLERCLHEPLAELSAGEAPRAARKVLGRVVHWTYTHHVQGYSLPKSLNLV